MNRFYDRTVNPDIQRRLREVLSPEEIRSLHRRSAFRHFALVVRQTALLVGLAVISYGVSHPAVWIPLALLQGFVILSFVILLHEQVHGLIFGKRRPGWERVMGLCYALPSAISASQFRRWHLDHHRELGTDDDDPKRAYLTPKRVSRWYKALYLTPALFVIYSIASVKAARHYPARLRLAINLEKVVVMGLHVALLLWLVDRGGFDLWFRVHGAPFFLAFPVAFTLNRLGQHYAIDPSDPAKWSTLIEEHWFWNWIFVYSNLHLEHHYLVGVPCYARPELQRKLRPFYAKIGLQPMGYGRILKQWFLENRAPHTDWGPGQAVPGSCSAPAPR